MNRRILLRVEKVLRRLGEGRMQRRRATDRPQADAWRQMLGRLNASEAERRLKEAELALNQLR